MMKSENINQSPMDNKILTGLEVAINRFFSAILFFLAPLMLYLNILVIPSVVIFLAFALFLFFQKKRHPLVNFFFFVLALGVYFIPLPIGWGLFLSLREYKFSGYVYNHAIVLWLAVRLIFVSLAAKNIMGDIASLSKPNEQMRNLLYFFSLIIILAITLIYPLSADYKLRDKAMQGGGNGKLSLVITKQESVITEPGKSGQSTSLARKFFTARYDTAAKKYIYRLNLPYPLDETIVFSSVKTDEKEINFVTDQNIECSHCQINKSSPKGIIFPAGQNIDFIISSDEFIKTIIFTELEGNIEDFIFWK